MFFHQCALDMKGFLAPLDFYKSLKKILRIVLFYPKTFLMSNKLLIQCELISQKSKAIISI